MNRFSSTPNSKLCYEHEVLWAKYEIREHYLKTIVRDIYENVGQMLSLVRVQLSMITQESGIEKQNLEDSGELVGKVIRDLRHMCRNFYLDTEPQNKADLFLALQYELTIIGAEVKQLWIRGNCQPIELGKALILFRMIQEILLQVQKQGSIASLHIKAIYGKKALGFIIEYKGAAIEKEFLEETNNSIALSRLNLFERAKLIGAVYSSLERPNNNKIKIVVPFNTSVYE